MSKEICLKEWSPKIAARMAKVRVARLIKAADEFQRDMSILYEDFDYFLCEAARDLDVEINNNLEIIEKAIAVTLDENGLI
jgi:hypothetical protein